MAEKKEKQEVVYLSSEPEEDIEVDDEETSSESGRDDGSDWNEEEEANLESSEDSDDDECGLKSTEVFDNEDSLKSTKVFDGEDSCNRVIDLLKGGSDIKEFKLADCKAYLRKHGLRLTGKKAVCIQRIKEHWRVQEGMGEKLYPRSSFSINCTGDVCTGDVVLFTQRVHERYDKVTRNKDSLQKRTIAGRVVKESYGAAKQQHTFTVEVLWSKGFKTLPPLFPLLVKGRNLYRFRTVRQCWDNEEERCIVLAEKHKRGGEARRLKATRTTRPASKHRNKFDHKGSPNRKRNKEFAERQSIDLQGKLNSRGPHNGNKQLVEAKNIDPQGLAPSRGNPNRGPYNGNKQFAKAQNIDPQGKAPLQGEPNRGPCNGNKQFAKAQNIDSQGKAPLQGETYRGPCHVYNYKAGSTSDAMRLAPFRDSTNQMLVPAHRNYSQKIDSQGKAPLQGEPNRGPCHVYNYKAVSDAMRSAPFLPAHQKYNQRSYGFHAYQYDERNVKSFVDQGDNLHEWYNQSNYGFHAYQYGERNVMKCVNQFGNLHQRPSQSNYRFQSGERNEYKQFHGPR